jgi:hypothetical protein
MHLYYPEMYYPLKPLGTVQEFIAHGPIIQGFTCWGVPSRVLPLRDVVQYHPGTHIHVYCIYPRGFIQG